MNKVVRLPNGNFITRKLVESDPAQLAKAKPEEIWTMNDGKSNSGKTTYTRDVLIRDMELTHLVNALRVQAQRAYSKMRLIGMIRVVPEKIDTESKSEFEVLMGQSGINAEVIAFAEKTMPKFRVMKDELEIRLGRKQREPEPVPEHTGRKFDFST